MSAGPRRGLAQVFARGGKRNARCLSFKADARRRGWRLTAKLTLTSVLMRIDRFDRLVGGRRGRFQQTEDVGLDPLAGELLVAIRSWFRRRRHRGGRRTVSGTGRVDEARPAGFLPAIGGRRA